MVEILLGSFVDLKTQFSKDMVYKIVKIVGGDYDLDVFKRGTIQLTIEDVIVLRDTAGVGTNVMC